jgi:alanine racemase
MRHTRAIIDLAAIRNNLAIIQQHISPPSGVIAVVKANAYGHGLVEIAKASLEAGCSHLAVAVPDEGALLRSAGITAPIVILGLAAPEEAAACAERQLIATVCAEEHLPPLARAAHAYRQPVQVMLKVDTGMNRIGAPPQEALRLAGLLHEAEGLAFSGLFTHFASAGGPDLAYAKKQLAILQDLLAKLKTRGILPPVISAAASSAIFTLPGSHFSLVRAGIIMYGLESSEFLAQQVRFQPALQWVTRVSHVKKVSQGSLVGYEMTWRAEEDCWIATLPVGYGDGYSRLLSNKGFVLVGGRRRPIVGNVCMDQLMVSLGKECDAKPGDEAVLVGSQGRERVSFAELAKIVGTINYELACNISARVPRVYIN